MKCISSRLSAPDATYGRAAVHGVMNPNFWSTKNMNRLLFLLFLIPISAEASLECKGSAFGLDSVWILNSGINRDLDVSETIFMNGQVIIERSGAAKHSSTVKSSVAGELESYYVFAPDTDSYTEIFAISKDLKAMGVSRPDPSSETGNFVKFRCTGSL